MDYKFGEYIRKRESDFLKTKVSSDDLIRIKDANTYLRDYLKQFNLHIVVVPKGTLCDGCKRNPAIKGYPIKICDTCLDNQD